MKKHLHASLTVVSRRNCSLISDINCPDSNCGLDIFGAEEMSRGRGPKDFEERAGHSDINFE